MIVWKRTVDKWNSSSVPVRITLRCPGVGLHLWGRIDVVCPCPLGWPFGGGFIGRLVSASAEPPRSGAGTDNLFAAWWARQRRRHGHVSIGNLPGWIERAIRGGRRPNGSRLCACGPEHRRNRLANRRSAPAWRHRRQSIPRDVPAGFYPFMVPCS
jgi:hypothetical protein